MVQVVNRKMFGRWPGAVYIGRGSIYGNPFRIGPDGSRAEVIERYRRRLWHYLQTDNELSKAIRDLADKAKTEDIVLECFCAPLPCHGDVLKAAIEWLNR
jgi:hypothetical protein